MWSAERDRNNHFNVAKGPRLRKDRTHKDLRHKFSICTGNSGENTQAFMGPPGLPNMEFAQ